jgi:predicted Zn-dependent peptidase
MPASAPTTSTNHRPDHFSPCADAAHAGHAEELQDAKEFTKGNLFLAAESVDNQMVRLAQNEIHYGTYIPLDDVVKKIETVTPEEIQALAASLFRSDQRCLTLLGPVGRVQ